MPISKLNVIRATIAAILVGMATLLIIVGVNLWLVRQTSIYSDVIARTRLERFAIVDLRNLLDDAETGQRGYLLTGGEAEYLAPYQAARNVIHDQLQQFQQATSADPALKDKASRLVPIVNEKFSELQQTIDLFNAGKPDEALALVKTDKGKQTMDEARKTFASMLDQSEANSSRAVSDEEQSIRDLQWISIIGAIVILLVAGGASWTVILYMRQLVAAQREVQDLNIGLEERVRERTADLGKANEEIQRFAYIVTHDLRAPLVNIMGFTSELETSLKAIQNFLQTPANEQVQETEAQQQARAAASEDLPEAIGFIRSSTAKMDGLINAILKLSREGRRVLKPETVNLESLIGRATESVQHQVTEAGGSIEIQANVRSVVSDRLALEQIVGNLLDNAVKYRLPGRPLKVNIQVREVQPRRVVIEVQDNGRGIAPQDHERVFDLFRRSGAQDQPGEGIGLAHVRTMIRNLGGYITLNSAPEQGTTFTINLPRDLGTVIAAQKGAA
jgi:signal transduction histidine kinase